MLFSFNRVMCQKPCRCYECVYGQMIIHFGCLSFLAPKSGAKSRSTPKLIIIPPYTQFSFFMAFDTLIHDNLDHYNLDLDNLEFHNLDFDNLDHDNLDHDDDKFKKHDDFCFKYSVK